MHSFTVAERELRAESRSSSNRWLRLLGPCLLVFPWLFMMLQGAAPGQQGALLFGQLNFFLFGLIWLVVPILTADAISRERREGTLGLLFLTPLTARGIVTGKCLTHAMRALFLLLATVPILSSCLTLGGVTWIDVITAVVFDLAAVLLALAAGLFASSFSRRCGGGALLLAECFSLLLALLTFLCPRYLPNPTGGWAFGRGSQRMFEQNDSLWLVTGLSWATGCQETWSGRMARFGVATAPVVKSWLQVVALVALSSTLTFRVVSRLAVWQVQTAWQEKPSPRWLVSLQAIFCQPILGRNYLKKSLGLRLSHNPISWLMTRTWHSRLLKWGWTMGVLLVETFLALNLGSYRSITDSISIQPVLGWLLLTSMGRHGRGKFPRGTGEWGAGAAAGDPAPGKAVDLGPVGGDLETVFPGHIAAGPGLGLHGDDGAGLGIEVPLDAAHWLSVGATAGTLFFPEEEAVSPGQSQHFIQWSAHSLYYSDPAKARTFIVGVCGPGFLSDRAAPV